MNTLTWKTEYFFEMQTSFNEKVKESREGEKKISHQDNKHLKIVIVL